MALHRAKTENKGEKLALHCPKKRYKNQFVKTTCWDFTEWLHVTLFIGQKSPDLESFHNLETTGRDSGKSHLLQRNGICMTT